MPIRNVLGRAVLVPVLVGVLAGCSALSSLDTAARDIDTYELAALPVGSVATRHTGRHLEVAVPTATGALASDRIAIKPTPLRVEALPDGRWINPAAEHVQLLLVRSLANSERYALVTSAGVGPTPDLVLLTDLQAFQAEIEGDAVRVVIRSTLTLLSGNDGRVLSSRRFEHQLAVPDTSAPRIAAGFDAAMTAQLREIVGWLAGAPGG